MRLVPMATYESATESEDDGRLLFAVNLRITAFGSRIEIQEQVTGIPAGEFICGSRRSQLDSGNRPFV